MIQRKLKRLKAQLSSQTPFIGGWCRQRSVKLLIREGSPDAIHILAETVTYHDDEQVVTSALEALWQLIDRRCINEVCAVWQYTRHPKLSELLTKKSWVASYPPNVKVFSALKVNRLTRVLPGGTDIIAPLVDACQDTEAEIAQRARECLPRLENPHAIDALCERWVARREPVLTHAILQAHYVARRPIRVQVFTALQTSQLQLVTAGGTAIIDPLIHACQDADATIAENAQRTLRQLKNPEAQDALCQLLIEQNHPLVHGIVLDAQYAPRHPHQRALFYFLTGQWEKYEQLDFDRTFLRAEYEAANESLKQRIVKIAKREGRREWAEIVVGRQGETFSNEEWEMLLAVFDRHEQWEKIWQFVQTAPVIWSVQALQRLKQVGWMPQNTGEQPGFLKLVHLSEGCVKTSGTLEVPESASPIIVRTSALTPEDESTPLKMSPQSVRCLAMSPDGKLLAGGKGQKDTTVRLWSLPNGKLLNTFGDHPGAVTCLAISPDGKWLMTGSYKIIQVWRLPEGIRSATLTGHTNWLRSLLISPDGRLLISGSQDNTIRLWQLPDGKSVRILEGHTDWVNCFVMSPDGRFIASGSDDQTIHLWRLPDGEHLKTLRRRTGGVERLALSANGDVLMSGSQHVCLWQLPDGRMLRAVNKHPDWLTRWLTSFPVSHDGRVLAQWSTEKTVRLWRLSTFFFLKYVNQISPEDIGCIQESLQDERISEVERTWLEFTLALLRWNHRFDIEVADTPQKIALGEFDIEIEE